jgi:hypothetical protein
MYLAIRRDGRLRIDDCEGSANPQNADYEPQKRAAKLHSTPPGGK